MLPIFFFMNETKIFLWEVKWLFNMFYFCFTQVNDWIELMSKIYFILYGFV